MKWQHTERSRGDYRAAPLDVQKAFDKQARLLSQDLRHPSLRAKKYEGGDVWQARVNRNWRFYFVIDGNVYVIVAIVPHPK
jgi:mRNA interferase RelE/StbE